MARWGLVIVAIYALVALLTPLLVSLGVLPDVNTGRDRDHGAGSEEDE